MGRLKEEIKKMARILREEDITSLTMDCYESLEKCKCCPYYEPKCKITLDAFENIFKKDDYQLR